MLDRMLGFFFTAVCGVPFLLIPKFYSDKDTPISFWSGDTSLKNKVQDVSSYNAAMIKLYRKYAFAYFAAGLGFLITPEIGVVLLCLACTVGIVIVYMEYKKILHTHS